MSYPPPLWSYVLRRGDAYFRIDVLILDTRRGECPYPVGFRERVEIDLTDSERYRILSNWKAGKLARD